MHDMHVSVRRTIVTIAMLAMTAALLPPAGASTPRGAAPAEIRGADGTLQGPNTSGLSRISGRGRAVLSNGLDVAIVASAAGDVTDSLFTDVRDKLLASGEFHSVSIMHAGFETPSLVDLLPFDALLVWSNFDLLDAETLGTNLADYVDFGRGVVLAVFASTSDVSGRFLAGRWESDGYAVVLPQLGNEVGDAVLGAIFDPDHPLVSGVSTFAGGPLSARPVTTQLMPGATLIAEWDDGKPLVAYRDDLGARRVDLGFYPPSDDVSFLYWDATTDGDALLTNALLYAAGQDATDVELRLVPLLAPSGVDTALDVDALPGQLCDAEPLPGSFVIELWASDSGTLNTGIIGFYLDLAFDSTVLEADALVHSALYPVLQEGTIDNLAGVIHNFGGSNLGSTPGIEPEWARIGHVEVSALAAGPTTMFSALGLGGLGVFGRTPPPLSEIAFGKAEYGCLADLDGSNEVDAADLGGLLGAWGENPGASADFNGNGFVGAEDLAALLGAWGPCCEVP